MNIQNNISKYIGTGSFDKSIKLYDINTWECNKSIQNEHNNGILCLLNLNPNMTHSLKIASGSSDSLNKIWDLDISKCFHTLIGHTSYVNNLIKMMDKYTIASAGGDGTVKNWDYQTTHCIKTILFEGSVGINFMILTQMTEGMVFVLAKVQSEIQLYNYNKEVESPLCGHTYTVDSIVDLHNPNKSQIASGTADTTIIIWDIEEGKLVKQL